MKVYEFWWDAGGEVDSFMLAINASKEQVKRAVAKVQKMSYYCRTDLEEIFRKAGIEFREVAIHKVEF